MKKELIQLLKAMFVILNSKITTDNMKEHVKIELLEAEIRVTFIPNSINTFNYTEIMSIVTYPLYYYAQIEGGNLVFHIY